MTALFVLDAGALVATDRADRRWLALWDYFVRHEIVPRVPAGVVGQVWRGGPRSVRVARVLGASEVRALDDPRARAAGELCGKARTSDPIDASVVLEAIAVEATIITSDPADMRHLADAAGVPVAIVPL